MTLLLPLIARYWKPMALAGVITAVMVYRAVLVHQRDAALAQVKTLTAEVSSLKTSAAAMTSAVAQQNAAVQQIRTQAAAQASAMNARTTAAETRATAVNNAAAAELNALKIAPIDPLCPSAIVWANDQAAELGRW